MPVICIGPVCIPLHLLLPFLLGLAHKYGWLTWVKREWVTLRYWRQRFGRRGPQAQQHGQQQHSKPTSGSAAPASAGSMAQRAKGESREPQLVAPGGPDATEKKGS